MFPKEFSDIISDAFDIRSSSDYEDFFVVSKDDIVRQTENAKTFLTSVVAYIETQYANR